MSDKKEQVKPLAPVAHRIHIQDSDAFPVEFTGRHHRKCIKACGCSAAILLIIVMVILVLMFTVFHVKDPVLKMNSVNIRGLDKLNLTTNPRPADLNLNLTIQADVSIKNPNVGSFKFSNATTYIYYGGAMIGGTRTPPGEAGARRTLRMNVSTELMVDKMMEDGRLERDLDTGMLRISSCTRISGKVKIARVIRRGVVVKLNCTMNVNVSRQSIQDMVCNRRVSL